MTYPSGYMNGIYTAEPLDVRSSIYPDLIDGSGAFEPSIRNLSSV